jgi:hypothetical protein
MLDQLHIGVSDTGTLTKSLLVKVQGRAVEQSCPVPSGQAHAVHRAFRGPRGMGKGPGPT